MTPAAASTRSWPPCSPRTLTHGRWHRAYQRDCDFGYGPVQVTGLAADRKPANFAVPDVAPTSWRHRRPRKTTSGAAARWGWLRQALHLRRQAPHSSAPG